MVRLQLHIPYGQMVEKCSRDIIFKIRDEFKLDKSIERLITLSPLTDMAKRFHLKNGAVLLNHNETSYYFEYELPK